MSRKTIGNGLLLLVTMASALLTGCIREVQDLQGGSPQPQSYLPAPLASKILRVTDLPVMGNKTSTLALIEVTDYQCPFCQAHFRETLPLLKREFIDTGRLSYYVLDYPLPGHEFAALAAIAASCAGDQQAYWQFHDALFEQPNLQSDTKLHVVADDLDLNIQVFEDCVESRRQGSFLDDRRSTALGLGVQGTPTFLLGRLSNGRMVTDIAVLPGLQSIGYFREVIGRYENRRVTGI